MPKISLIGKDLAKEGIEFVFAGPLPTCSDCRVKNVCFNLEQGHKYRVTKVREQLNPCIIFNGDKVNTVEVEELEDFFIIQESKKLQEGAIVTMKSMNCDYITCPNIEKCNLYYQKNDLKVAIKSIGQNVNCPKGFKMKKVQVTYK
ncbi:hypothetical protein [Thermoplasma volcanium GSS1]|uniref:UPF0179 protein TV1250 n=1 Tax=Thermoplasma volcanium (strain ATCC 51530 / DSM 4299 / JCM 9571 / NBRC 15438 / GSS1) TaxID=273116 RepID=Y1250_THEVO|nr:UPF0179 family protein [Thermoplasma volcanium]Q979B2.1 RecName: Full=UPF0179 protein TV1250 [Thermoplasma volcanium GSS1]BAB60392.1 hypothetical protein [Thermoplasma volcanium GSS1]